MPAELLSHALPFDPADAKAALTQLPRADAVFALYGADAHAEPYTGRTPNLGGRLERLLQPSARHPRRLQLAGRVRRIEYRLTGSDFESLLLQFQLLDKVYSAGSLERMHLRAPAFIRYLGTNAYPRIVVTNRMSQREADWTYGPFSARAAAERFADEALKLFLLRRCTEDLDPNPAHPGCVYSEMKMCLAPCYQGCADARYAEEASAVERFIATRGESRLVTLKAERDQASADLEFEAAAALHTQVQKVEAVRALAPELVRPLSKLRAVVMQASAEPDQVAVFLFESGALRGPLPFSTMGMRIQNEQSGSSSLFAQPLAIQAVPEEQGTVDGRQSTIHSGLQDGSPLEAAAALRLTAAAKAPRGLLEARMDAVLAALTHEVQPPTATARQGHLALLKRWYYRPEVRRVGEICFPDADGGWPIKSMLRSAGRVAGRMFAAAAASKVEARAQQAADPHPHQPEAVPPDPVPPDPVPPE